VVSFAPRPLYIRVRTLDTHWIGGWVSEPNSNEKFQGFNVSLIPSLTPF